MPKTKKIIYLSANSSFSHFTPAYGMIRTYAEKHSPAFEWGLVDFTINDNPGIVIGKSLALDPDIIISTLYLFNHAYVLRLLKKIKILKPGTCIVLGGPEFLGNNEQFLRSNPEIYAVFRGDESSFPEFLNNFPLSDKNKPVIPGLCIISGGEYLDCGTAFFEGPFDELPSAYTKKYFPGNRPFIHYETSRGCPSSCTFCTSSVSGLMKFHGIERISSDLDAIREAGIRNVRLLDRTFNVPSERAAGLIELFNNRYPDMKFHIEVDPSSVNKRFISSLSTSPAGKYHVEAGIQTFNENVLKNIRRKVLAGAVEENLQKLCQLKSAAVHVDLITGLPGQDFSTVVFDTEKLITLGPDEIQMETLKMLPGTPIVTEDTSEIKYLNEPPYEVLETDTMAFCDLVRCSTLSKIIDSFYNMPCLKNLFRYAVMSIPGFLTGFLEYAEDRFVVPEKPSLSSRFDMLLSYASMIKDEALSELTAFTCVMSGFFNPSLKGLSIARKEFIRYEEMKPVWCEPGELSDKPVYIFSAGFNVAEIWIDPRRTLIRSNRRYCLRLSSERQNRRVSRIYDLCNIPLRSES